jgi:hypothetical protein
MSKGNSAKPMALKAANGSIIRLAVDERLAVLAALKAQQEATEQLRAVGAAILTRRGLPATGNFELADNGWSLVLAAAAVPTGEEVAVGDA